MSSSDVQVTFGGDTQPFNQAVDSAKAKLGELSNQASQSAKTVGDSLDGLSDKSGGVDNLTAAFGRLAAIVGVSLSVDAFKRWGDSVVEAGDKVAEQASRMGVSLAQVQTINGIGALAGSSGESILTGLEALNTALAKTAEEGDETRAAMAALGLSEDQLKDKSPTAQLEAIAAAMSKFADGSTKTAAATKLLGTAGSELIRTLDGGAEGVRQLEDSVRRAGAAFEGPTISAMVEYQRHTKELEQAWTGFGNRVYTLVAPAVDLAKQKLSALIESIDEGTLRGALLAIGDTTIAILEKVGEFAVKTKAAIDALAGSLNPANWPGFSQIDSFLDGVASKLDYLNSKQGHDDFEKGVDDLYRRVGLISQETYDKLTAGLNEAGKTGEQAFGGLDVAATRTALNLAKVQGAAEAARQALRGLDPLGKPLDGSNKDYPRTRDASGKALPQVPVMDTDKDDKTDKSAYDEARQAFDQAITRAHDAEEQTHAALEGMLKTHQITWDQWLRQSTTALDHEQDAIQDAADKALATDGLTTSQKTALAEREEHEMATIARRLTEDQSKAAEEVAKKWDSAFNEINSAFDSQVSGLLKGTTSWATAFKNVLESLTEDIIKFGLKWALTQAETVAKNVALQQTQVTAHVAGDAAMTGADQAAGAAGAFSWIGGVLKAIEGFAAQTFAGVTAFMAPILGPAAPAAGAAAEASVLAAGAVASADIGMWDVPHDQLALVHHNELIMPAGPANALRGMLSGGAGAGAGAGGGVSVNPSTHFHVSALDGASVAQFWRNNSSSMMKAVDEAVRHGAHLGMRRLKPA